MGEINNAMNDYLGNVERFADFFNGTMFDGESIVKTEGLDDASEKYNQSMAFNPRTKERGKTVERIRDLKMKYNDGVCLRILGLEGQDYIDYGAGVRGAEYDIMEYRSQMKHLKAGVDNNKEKLSKSELFSGMRRDDHLNPTYTIWFYYGTEPYDGPKSLSDMMNFPEDDKFRRYFSDYKLNVICLNDINDMSVFHTELRQLFKLMKCRDSSKAMRQLLENDTDYNSVKEDTLYTMSVVASNPRLWEEREKYINGDEREVNYNMCLAFDQIEAEEREKGREEGEEIIRIRLICKKLARGKELEEIADDLEEEAEDIRLMYDVAAGFAPDYNVEDVYRAYRREMDAVID